MQETQETLATKTEAVCLEDSKAERPRFSGPILLVSFIHLSIFFKGFKEGAKKNGLQTIYILFIC